MGSKWKELCTFENFGFLGSNLDPLLSRNCFLPLWICIVHFLVARASWSLVTQGVGPSPRSVHAAAWDSSSERFWVHAGAGERILKDLWIFDAATNTWTLLTSLQDGPSERKDHVAVWDSTGQALWIHGGYDGNNFVKELWKFVQNNWTMVAGNSVAGPSARSEHVAVWDSMNSILWIHGGYDGSLKSDLWKYDSVSSDWLLIPPSSDLPSGRAQHVAAWDDTHQAIWLHGGYDELGALVARVFDGHCVQRCQYKDNRSFFNLLRKYLLQAFLAYALYFFLHIYIYSLCILSMRLFRIDAHPA